MDTRTCSKCKETKPLSGFWRGKNNSWCAACQKAYRAARSEGYRKSPKNIAAQAAWRKTARGRLFNIVSSARGRAKKAGLTFELSASDVTMPTHCPVLGIELDTGRRDHASSLERIIPEKGYTRDNVIIISMRANRIKSDASIEEILLIADFYRPHFVHQVPSLSE